MSVNPFPEMDSVSTAEPEPSPFDPIPRGEPVPDWEEARIVWKSTWNIHVYGFATIFLLFTIFSTYRFLKLYSFKAARMSNGYQLKLGLYIAICLFSLLRSLVLFTDAYNSWNIFPPILAKVLWSLAYPCLIGAFTVLLAVLLATTNACHRGKSLASSYKHGIGMGCCLLGYTALVVTADWAVMYSQRSIFLLVLCQVIFIAWGTIVMIGYASIACKITRDLSRTPLNVDRGLLRSFARLLCVCSVIGGICILMKFYAAVSTFSSRSESEDSPQPWRWLAFETTQRAIECSMCLLLILITGRADRKREILVVPKIMCNGITIISGLESGTVLKDIRLKDKQIIH
ncbi:proline-rich transmembrane protein 4-like [Lytechinus pictus]|uniref:proline-rich transmembrane protein 4-like n=1 Tax=Lytechinus pictus TaxID=7653 RepID=UPI0030B9C7A1